ncbi:uncharacterized protein BJ171DRAFT_52128 [Polychytrium aggregatum]|uniref:uncharacterized protein n=1 Tax=Polychytrium aggregatum TaxID=110093 RepID=UPI0022FDCD51|nr:uncharacterized protein BJ171DRAFT_52128 [Polychytrium aggregatum]KAI9205787.1 hypothetical protein BJ171DRAFT_52128 [Polychytrium aggregatum]
MANTFLENVVGLLLVAVCWGGTNPFIKLGSQGLDDVTKKYQGHPWWRRQWEEIRFLWTNWKYVVPLAINLSGSMVYYYTLGNSDLSLVVPITNSLTFALTTAVGYCLGEEMESRETILGVALVFAGVVLCILSKMDT